MKGFEKIIRNSVLSALALNTVRALLFCLLMLFVAIGSAKALDPNKRITQYGHTAWRVLDGFLASPRIVAQTKDGYAWVGTRDGVMRFDGVKFTPLTPPEGQDYPGRTVASLLGASDGSLWIGTASGIAQLKDGQIINFPSILGKSGVNTILEDETGSIWFTRYRITDGKGPLCRIKDNDLQCFGKEEGVPAPFGLGLAKDREGKIWFGSSYLCRWSPGSFESFFKDELEKNASSGMQDVAVDSFGQVWVALSVTGPGLGLRRFADGKWSGYAVPGFDSEMILANKIYMDRNNSLWVGTKSEGLYRIHNGIVDHYGMKNGLSGNFISDIIEDREGNLWVTTNNGVDMFRDTYVVNFTQNEGLSSVDTQFILGLSNGSVWVGNSKAVDIIPPVASDHKISILQGLPKVEMGGALEDRLGRIWLNVGNKVMVYENGQFSEPKKQDGSLLGIIGSVWAMTNDSNDNIWVGAMKDYKRRLLRIRDGILQEEISLEHLAYRAETLAGDPNGSLWIGSSRDNLTRRHQNGQMETVSLGEGGSVTIYSISVDPDGALVVGTIKGLYRWKDGILTLLDTRNGLPCAPVYSALEDNSGNLWLYANCGILRISASDFARWRTDPESKVSVRRFDALDGALPAPGNVFQPRRTKSTDGRLWFINGLVVQMIDPSRDYTNTTPPPVYIEGVVADRKSYQMQPEITLPPLKSELEINFTALSYAIPRKVNFRYKLEGHDPDWQDVGTRRQAFYNNLGPGQYRFRVIASNNDGVWNETGASLDFTIEPTWYQTTAFRLLCILLVGFTAWALYKLRIRQISRVISARFDERLAERTRLARELHDTFIQTIQGSKMVADDALEKVDDPVYLRRAMEQLSTWLGQANDEGRAALNSLRTPATQTNDLGEALRRATEACQLQENAEVRFSVVGCARELHPIVRDEIYRIGYEAIRNACQHSKASQLDVELKYAQDLIVRVKDDGIGIDQVVATDGKAGHFGLQGMRERAAQIGAKLSIDSSPNYGTEITLVVPGGLVFRKAVETTRIDVPYVSSETR